MTTEMTLGDYIRVFKRRRKLLVAVPLIALLLSYFYARSLTEVFITKAQMEIQKNMLREGAGVQRGAISTFERVTVAKLASNKEVAKIAADILQKMHRAKYESASIEAMSSQIRGVVTVANVDNSNIIEVAARGSDPILITDFCNAYARAVKEHQVKERARSIADLRGYLQVQIGLYEQKFETLDNELIALRRSGQGPDGSTPMTPESLSRVQTRMAEIAAMEAELAERNRNLKIATDSRNLDALVANLSSSDIRRDNAELAKKRSDLNGAAKQFTEKHPVVEKLRQEVGTLEQLLLEKALPAATTEMLANAEQQEQLAVENVRLKTEREMILAAMESLPERLKKESSKQRELGIITSVSGMFRQRLEDLDISLRAPMDNLEIIELASVPRIAVYPNRRMIIVMGLTIGCMLSLAFAFLAESLDTSLTAMRDVERFIAKPILAVIPSISIDPERIAKSKSPIKKELLAKIPLLVDHRSPAAEAFRTLRAILQSRFFNAGKKTLLITSSTPQEGKTTTTINLALACADAGMSTVIVGGNMRHPVIGRHFQIDRSRGLHDYLEGSITMEEALQPTGYANLFIVDAGTFARRPAELLARPEFDALLAKLKENFDVVLVDSPPTLPVADAATMASRVDGILVVYLVSVAPRDALLRCKETLEEVGGNVIGIVFNDVWGASQDDYAGYYYHHKYAADELKRI